MSKPTQGTLTIRKPPARRKKLHVPRRSFAPLYRLLVADLESVVGKESSQACRIDAALDNRSFFHALG
jgi:hypothetical protein